jgi:hypothetical protein
VIDASAAASSTNIFNIPASLERKEQCSSFVLRSQGLVVGQFEK